MSKVNDYLYLVITDRLDSVGAKVTAFALLLFSFLYGLIVRIIIFFSGLKKKDLGLPVISVGNITWGGTGKTPFVIHLANLLKSKGKKPAVLTRGYSLDKSKSDEAKMMQDYLGDVMILEDKDRVKSAQSAKEKAADILILDDGFQQWGIKKDLEIVMINSLQPLGNGHLIPRGILREPLSSLKRADIIIFNKIDNKSAHFEKGETRIRGINSGALLVESQYEAVELTDIKNQPKGLEALDQVRVLLVSALAEPLYFEKTVQDLGAELFYHLRFRDHYNYTQEDIDNILKKAVESEAEIIVTTEKDMVKFEPFEGKLIAADVQIFALKIEFQITKNSKDLEKEINSVLNG